MSHKLASTLHIEWLPGCVQAVDTNFGKNTTAKDIAGLGSLLNGHKRAVVGIGRSLVFWKAIRLPLVPPDDLRRILEVQLSQLFPLPADQLAFDFIQTTDHTVEGNLTLVAAIRIEHLQQVRTELQQANISALHIMPVSLGSPAVADLAGYRSALVMEMTPAGIALDVVTDGVVRFSRTVPAESDITTEIMRTLAAANAGDLPLVGTENIKLSNSTTVTCTALDMLHNAPAFSFELTDERIRAKQMRAMSQMRTALITFLVILLGCTLVWNARSKEISTLQQRNARQEKQFSALRSAVKLETTRSKKLISLHTTILKAFEPAQPLSDLIGVVSDCLPAGSWLTGLDIERGRPVQIRGDARNADEVANFVTNLNTTGRFRNVRLIFANSSRIEQTPVVQFNITALGIGNLPGPETPKVSRKSIKPDTESIEAGVQQ